MLSIEKCSVPAQSFLSKYSLDGTYADSYVTEVQGYIPFPTYVFAFYTTALFKVEAFILTYSVKRPSDDGQAQELADGSRNEFAAWNVEGRSENELLMCDMSGRTRSWFMVRHLDSCTQLYFGSAVVPKKKQNNRNIVTRFYLHSIAGFSSNLLYPTFVFCKAKSGGAINNQMTTSIFHYPTKIRSLRRTGNSWRTPPKLQNALRSE
jgi:hypothetical protein